MALRAEAYYEALGYELSDEEWVFAVREANRGQTFFPSPAELLEYGRLFRAHGDSHERPYRQTPELTHGERAERERNAAAGLALIESKLKESGAALLPHQQPRLERMRERLGFKSMGQVLLEPSAEQKRDVRELAEKFMEATSVAEEA